jgi:hypothetical protein
MFLTTTLKTPSWLTGSRNKGSHIDCRKKESHRYDALPYPGTGKLRFGWKRYVAGRRQRSPKKASLDDNDDACLERAVESPEQMTTAHTQEDSSDR